MKDTLPAFAPRVASETMKRLVGPPMGAAITRLTNKFRRLKGETEVVTLEDAEHDKDFRDFVHAYGESLVLLSGLSRERAADQLELLAYHLLYAINYELHRRKTFWVSEALAYLLGQTTLDIEGETLKLPHPSCAFVFTDAATLDLANRLLEADDPEWLREAGAVKVVTTHLTEHDRSDEGVGLTIDLLFDTLTDVKWPYVLSRTLYVQPTDRLDAILDSHFPDIDLDDLDEVFAGNALKPLLQLVINAVLYATSADVDMPVIKSPIEGARRAMPKKGGKKRAKAERKVARLINQATGEDVFYLPGKVPITQVRRFQEVERGEGGRQLMTRHMVRGHWRRANPNWTDQRPRWIEPYWKGPDMATVIERQYELR